MSVTDLENTMVSRDLNSQHNLIGISVTSSATMRWMTLRGIDSLALVGVNVNVTMVKGLLLLFVCDVRIPNLFYYCTRTVIRQYAGLN